MSKIFISYRFTGEDVKEVEARLDKLCGALAEAGHEVFCNVKFDEMYLRENYSIQQIMSHALSELDKSDILFAYVNSPDRSEGMLIEIGYALGKNKPIILAARKGSGVHSSKGVANQYIEFDDMDDLLEKIKRIDYARN